MVQIHPPQPKVFKNQSWFGNGWTAWVQRRHAVLTDTLPGDCKLVCSQLFKPTARNEGHCSPRQTLYALSYGVSFFPERSKGKTSTEKAFFEWPHRLVVRTVGFHPRNMGSTPVGATIKAFASWLAKLQGGDVLARSIGVKPVTLGSLKRV